MDLFFCNVRARQKSPLSVLARTPAVIFDNSGILATRKPANAWLDKLSPSTVGLR